jgi:molybdopterin-guanine dinucleotide biosynthesis protein MobB
VLAFSDTDRGRWAFYTFDPNPLCPNRKLLMPTPTPAVAFIARSGTGKTTLVEALIGELTARGRRVGALKHDAHKFEIDRPGKDSSRFTAAGAEVMVLVSDDKIAMVKRPREPEKLDFILHKWFNGLDLVLVEGYKTSDLPKVEIQRAVLAQPLLSRGQRHDPYLVAVVSDVDQDLDVPVLPLDSPAVIADWLEERFLGEGPGQT